MNPKIEFTPEEVELAAKVSNDIAEDIDCKETRAQLRRCIAYWAWQYTMLSTIHSTSLSKLATDTFAAWTEAMTKTLEQRYWGPTGKPKYNKDTK